MIGVKRPYRAEKNTIEIQDFGRRKRKNNRDSQDVKNLLKKYGGAEGQILNIDKIIDELYLNPFFR